MECEKYEMSRPVSENNLVFGFSLFDQGLKSDLIANVD